MGPPADTHTPQHEGSVLDVGRIGRRVALFVAVAVVGVVALATLPGVSEVRERVASARPAWIAVAALCSLASMLGFVLALWGAFERFVPARAAVDLGFAEQGANVLLPAGGTGGPALGTLLMRRAGVPTELAAERHAALFLVTSAVSLLALVLFGTLEAVGVLPGEHALALTLIPAAAGLAGLAVSVLFAHTALPAEPAAERRVRHGVWRLRRFLRGGVRTSLELLRAGDPIFVAGAVAYYAFDIAALAATFQSFGGGGPPLGVFVLAYTIGHAGALIPTPGGVGGTDGGLIAAFVLFGAPLGLATAAVLGYRVFQLGLPVVLGSVGLLRLRARLGDDAQREAVARRFAKIG
ncbi:MAG: lysylphosphatidylglycerol synthase transmembrane domain-containing protein [Solirubrobacteraceae bacterium]